MNVFFLIPSLRPSGLAQQVLLLAPALVQRQVRVQVCAFGPNTLWADELRRSGVSVACLEARSAFSPRPLWQLREHLNAFAPDLIHAWGRPALLALSAVAPWKMPIVLSGAARPTGHGKIPWYEAQLLRRLPRRLIVTGPAEAEACRRLGVSEARLALLPLAVKPLSEQTDREAVCKAHNLPKEARWLACVGPLDPIKAFRDAIWAFDILRFIRPDIALVFLGEGPEDEKLRESVRITQAQDQVHFLRSIVNVHELLGHTEALWVPGKADRGRNAALLAMASGCPVVATQRPAFEELFGKDPCGLLVPPGEPAALARGVRQILDEPEFRRHLGFQGRQRANQEFSVETLVSCALTVYDTVV